MRLLAILSVILFLAGCAETTLNTTRGPAYSDDFRLGRVMVLAQMPENARSAVEAKMVEMLSKGGISTFRSRDVLPDLPEQVDWNTGPQIRRFQEAARRGNADSMLLLGGVSTSSRYEWTGGFLAPSLLEHRKKHFGVRLYDLTSPNATWIAGGESQDSWLVSPSVFAGYVTEAVYAKLAEDGFLARR